jgi:hypothetical protein
MVFVFVVGGGGGSGGGILIIIIILIQNIKLLHSILETENNFKNLHNMQNLL